MANRHQVSRQGKDVRSKIKQGLIVGGFALIVGGTALGGEGVEIKIMNDGTEDILVTVYDMNARPARIVLENARITGFTSVPIFALGDAMGHAKLSWTATSSDGVTLKCGHDESVALPDSGSLTVSADSSCASLAST